MYRIIVLRGRFKAKITHTKINAAGTRYWSSGDNDALMKWARQLVLFDILKFRLLMRFLYFGNVAGFSQAPLYRQCTRTQLNWLLTDKQIAGKTRLAANNHATWLRQVCTTPDALPNTLSHMFSHGYVYLGRSDNALWTATLDLNLHQPITTALQ